MRHIDAFNVIAQFAELFDGNKEAVGTETGGCARIEEPFSWRNQIEGHLTIGSPIGVYPLLLDWQTKGDAHEGWLVKWGCVDFDIKSEHHKSFDYETENEAHVAAVNLQLVLKHMGVTGWIERTRSHGRHVWVFADSWVRASSMRRALLVACGVAGVSSREVNPKSEELAEGQLGNYVRLPLPGHLGDSPNYARRIIIANDESRYDIARFVRLALLGRSAPHILDKIAALYVAPVVNSKGIVPRESLGLGGTLVDRMLPYTFECFDQDMPEDRSGQLLALASHAARQTKNPFDPEEVYEIVYDADERWGKFVGRVDRAKRLADIVERAYR